MRCLFVSSDASERCERAKSFVVEHPTATVVASTLAAASAILAEANDGTSRTRARPRTLRSLAEQLARPAMLAEGCSLVAPVAILSLLAELLQDPSLPLGRYEALRGLRSGPEVLLRTLDELRWNRIHPDALELFDRELARLERRLEDTLVARRWIDTIGLFARAHRVPSTTPMVVHDVGFRVALEVDLLRGLLAGPHPLVVTVSEGDTRTLEILAPLGLPIERGSKARPVARALRDPSRPRLPERTVHVVSGPTVYAEVEALVRSIAARIDSGAPPRMGIVLYDPETYREVFADVLDRAAIPFTSEDAVRAPDPSGRAFLALLEMRRSGLSAHAFAEYLSVGAHPEVGLDGEPVAPPESEREDLPEHAPKRASPLRAPRDWLKLLRDASVVGGDPARWERRLSSLERELRVLRKGLLDDEAALRAHDQRVEALVRFRGFVLPLVRQLAALPERATPHTFHSALRALATTSLADPRRVHRLLDRIGGLANPSGELALDSLIDGLARHLVVVPRKARHPGAHVTLLGTRELRGRAFDVLFVPGLVEEGFPRRPIPDPLLPDSVRRRLSPTLETRDSKLDAERDLLVALAEAAPELVVSFPRLGKRGREQSPSMFALDLVRADRGVFVSGDVLRAEARATERATVLDAREALLERLREGGGVSDLVGAGRPFRRAAVRAHRLESKRFTAARGVKLDASEIPLLEQTAPRVVSASTLETYAACPYRFFLKAWVGLRERDPLTAPADLDARTLGSLAHEVLFEVSRQVQAGASFAEAVEDSFARVAESFLDRITPASPARFAHELERLRQDLGAFARKVAASWEPVFAELGFGLPTDASHDEASVRGPVELTIEGERLVIRGSIDLVAAIDGHLAVIDYKTGELQAKTDSVIGQGTILQPILYALVVERLIAERGIAVPAGLEVEEGRLVSCTSKGRFATRSFPVREEALAPLVRALRASRSLGVFPRSPSSARRDGCSGCPYTRLCGDATVPEGPAPAQLLELRRCP